MLGIPAGLAVFDHPLLAAIIAPTAVVIFWGLKDVPGARVVPFSCHFKME